MAAAPPSRSSSAFSTGTSNATGATREHAHDLPGRNVEGRAGLRSVEHAESSGRTGADVDQSPTALEAVDDAVDRLHDRGLRGLHGVGYSMHVRAHERDELLDREAVEILELVPDLLGSQASQIGAVARAVHRSESAISRWTTRRSSACSSRRRTGCTPPISNTTAMPASGAISSEVPVNPVCQ